jgi:DNA-damage-inducible protein D
MMTMNTSIALFEQKEIRKIWHKNEWRFSVVDVVFALTDSVDAKDYRYRMKVRVKTDEWFELSTICRQLKLPSSDAKYYATDCANTEWIFRIIQSIPSPKAEPFKLRLAKVGYERIQEIQNPELAQDRMKLIYEQKWYPREWIERRLRGIAIRQELTDEWKSRWVNSNTDYAILTNEISQASFGMTVWEYMKYKWLSRKNNHNLRDNMTDFEIVLTMLGETTTTNLHRKRDSKQFHEPKKDANDGGSVAGNARKDIEKKLWESVISDKNHFHLTQKKLKKK